MKIYIMTTINKESKIFYRAVWLVTSTLGGVDQCGIFCTDAVPLRCLARVAHQLSLCHTWKYGFNPAISFQPDIDDVWI